MTSLETFFAASKARFGESELANRIALARGHYPDEEVGKPPFRRMVAELEVLFKPILRSVRKFDVQTATRPQKIILLPGFGASPAQMRFLARNLEAAGHKTKKWGLGRNWGVAEETLQTLEARLIAVCDRYQEPVVLLGWSLGGLYARELAKRYPGLVSKVITMGSPFSGSPRANNVWRIYQAVTGHRVDEPPIDVDLSAKPPVETVAMWSPDDGMIAPHAASGLPGERDRAIAVKVTHCGFAYAPQSIQAVLAELERAASV
ncbi:alpha/beta fold hydrolase [Erythrobacter sp. SCSIO 43205]|uniref:esterase/lipase family protein n=1 Tax=Erythrobacter sp. SCSIO 43205 TaxID=2779361 RepID=UPI001CA9B193|nr:alpha/beta fold hydrolase [Erythrobacter sp. SCSIO 43205]UAB77607.1 alpha/beta fold hydrolase [Erythrobacter sp. SCSIO 43205]